MPLTREDRLRLIEHLKETLDPEGWVPKVGDRVRCHHNSYTYVVFGVNPSGSLKVRTDGDAEYEYDHMDVCHFYLLERPTKAPAEDPLAFLDRTKYRVQWFYDGWAVDGPTRMGVITRGHRTSREAIEAAQAKEGK